MNPMPKPGAKVIPISEGRRVSREIADLAFCFWLERSFRHGSPEEDLLRAVMETTFKPERDQASRRLFLVRSRYS